MKGQTAPKPLPLSPFRCWRPGAGQGAAAFGCAFCPCIISKMEEKSMSKRSAQGAGTIRKKVVARQGKTYTYWEARVTVGSAPGTGKQIQ